MKTIFLQWVILWLFIASHSGFALTAKPPAQRPCEPECCISIKGYIFYYCFPSTIRCNVLCEAECPHPEFGNIYYSCGNYQVETELCAKFEKVRGTTGCDVNEIEIARQEIENQADGYCYTFCYAYLFAGCRWGKQLSCSITIGRKKKKKINLYWWFSFFISFL